MNSNKRPYGTKITRVIKRSLFVVSLLSLLLGVFAALGSLNYMFYLGFVAAPCFFYVCLEFISYEKLGYFKSDFKKIRANAKRSSVKTWENP
ncbi:MAG: hypothetical protein ACI9TY_000761 [Alphaproteobacteria bacterium]|jgi:hypothetical protein